MKASGTYEETAARTAAACDPTTTTIRPAPAARRKSTAYAKRGLPATSTSALGLFAVRSLRRVPMPAARRTPVRLDLLSGIRFGNGGFLDKRQQFAEFADDHHVRIPLVPYLPIEGPLLGHESDSVFERYGRVVKRVAYQ